MLVPYVQINYYGAEKQHFLKFKNKYFLSKKITTPFHSLFWVRAVAGGQWLREFCSSAIWNYNIGDT